MPIYEYVCRACDNEWEVLQKVNEEPPKECPKCANSQPKTIHRVISRSSFQLKGDGWYATDFKSSSSES